MDVSKIMEIVEKNKENPSELRKIKRTVEQLFEQGKTELGLVLDKINEYLSEEGRPTSLTGKIIVEIDKLTPVIHTLKDVIEYRLERGLNIPVTLKYDLDNIINTLENNIKILKDIRRTLQTK